MEYTVKTVKATALVRRQLLSYFCYLVYSAILVTAT